MKHLLLPINSNPNVPTGKLFFLNDKYFYIKYPKRKDGKKDMRYSINQIDKILKRKYD